MAQLHYVVVYDTESATVLVTGCEEAPVDSDEYVFDQDTDEWRGPTDEEYAAYMEMESHLVEAMRDVNEGLDAEFSAGVGALNPAMFALYIPEEQRDE